MKPIFFSFTLLLAMVMGGCASQQPATGMYAWGSFPQQNYLMYTQPGKATPSQQIKELEALIEKSKATQLAVPPGLYSHLGLMYLMNQQMDQANHYFSLERQVYPESAVLMDRFLQKTNVQTGLSK